VAAMDHVTPDAGFFDWEADRRGETELAVDRSVSGGDESEQSSTTIVDDTPRRGTDGTEDPR